MMPPAYRETDHPRDPHTGEFVAADRPEIEGVELTDISWETRFALPLVLSQHPEFETLLMETANAVGTQFTVDGAVGSLALAFPFTPGVVARKYHKLRDSAVMQVSLNDAGRPDGSRDRYLHLEIRVGNVSSNLFPTEWKYLGGSTYILHEGIDDVAGHLRILIKAAAYNAARESSAVTRHHDG